jgi:hypothetical protein
VFKRPVFRALMRIECDRWAVSARSSSCLASSTRFFSSLARRAVARWRLRQPCLKAFIRLFCLPSAVLAPVDFSQGRISRMRCLRRSRSAAVIIVRWWIGSHGRSSLVSGFLLRGREGAKALGEAIAQHGHPLVKSLWIMVCNLLQLRWSDVFGKGKRWK